MTNTECDALTSELVEMKAKLAQEMRMADHYRAAMKQTDEQVIPAITAELADVKASRERLRRVAHAAITLSNFYPNDTNVHVAQMDHVLASLDRGDLVELDLDAPDAEQS